MLAYYLHDLNPFAIRFADHWFTSWIVYLFHLVGINVIGIRWYGISYLTGFICAFLLLRYLASKKAGPQLRMPPDKIADFVLTVCIFGVLLGGRLGYVLFYDLPYGLSHNITPLLWSFGGAFPWWGVLRVWQGGMSAHGGALGVAIVVFLFARRHKYSLVNLGDACCMVVPLGLFFGRIANFINGELYGHITNVWWAVKFPTEIANPTNDRIAHYLGTYNERNDFIPGPALKDAVITMGQAVNNLRNQMQLPPLDATRAELVHLFYHPADMLPSSIHADPAQIDQVHNVLRQQFDALLQPRHPSQLYEACLEGLALFAICWLVGRLWKKDGMASSAFLIFYPVMRIIGEQFRVGDTPVLLFGFAVSKGILYSIPMLILGIVYWVYWVRQPPRDSAPGLRLKPDAHA